MAFRDLSLHICTGCGKSRFSEHVRYQYVFRIRPGGWFSTVDQPDSVAEYGIFSATCVVVCACSTFFAAFPVRM